MPSSPYVGLDALKPALLFAASSTLTTAALHFPVKSHRFFLIPTWVLAAGSLASVDSKRASSNLVGLDSYIAITSILFMLILPRILFVERHSLLTTVKKSPATPESNNVLWPDRHTISAACRLWNNPRHLTLKQPSPETKPAIWSPSLLMQLVPRVLKVAAIILVDRILVQRVQQHLFKESSFLDFTPDQHPIIRPLLNHLTGDYDHDPVTARQLLLRAFMSVSWIWANFTLLEFCHAVLSTFFVLILRLDNPEDWPPLFGNPLEAWSIRRFWGRFWHRIATPTLLKSTQTVIYRVLKPDGKFTKILEIFGVFFLSGLVHAVAAWRMGEGFEYLDIWFFSANFAAIGVELLIGMLWRSVVSGTQVEVLLLRSPRARAAGKALGFVWVFVWFFWAVPRWLYPKTLRWSIKQALIQSR